MSCHDNKWEHTRIHENKKETQETKIYKLTLHLKSNTSLLTTFFLNKRWALPLRIPTFSWMLSCSCLHRNPFYKRPSVFNVATFSSFVSSTHSLNSDRWGTDKRRSLRHCKVMELWSHAVFKIILIGLTLHYQLGKMLIWLEAPETGNVKSILPVTSRIQEKGGYSMRKTMTKE